MNSSSAHQDRELRQQKNLAVAIRLHGTTHSIDDLGGHQADASLSWHHPSLVVYLGCLAALESTA